MYFRKLLILKVSISRTSVDEYQFLYYDIRILCIFLRLGSDFRRANMHSWPEVTFWGKAPSLRGAAFFLSPTVYYHFLE